MKEPVSVTTGDAMLAGDAELATANDMPVAKANRKLQAAERPLALDLFGTKRC
jgi:hypothetical protein